MSRILCVGLAGHFASLAQAETGRLFFDLAGNGGNQNAAHPGGLAMTNPQLPDGGGRLYLYWEFGRPGGSNSQNVLGLNYNVDVDGGVITQALNYQPDIAGRSRWQDVPGNPVPNPAVNPGGDRQAFTAVNITAFGLQNGDSAIASDQGYDAATNTTILGYVNVSGSAGATIWIEIHPLGIAIQGGGPNDDIYLGFGDGPAGPGPRSVIPEATIIPEPATLLLLCGGLSLLRRK